MREEKAETNFLVKEHRGCRFLNKTFRRIDLNVGAVSEETGLARVSPLNCSRVICSEG